MVWTLGEGNPVKDCKLLMTDVSSRSHFQSQVKISSAQVVEMSVTNNSCLKAYHHLDDHTRWTTNINNYKIYFVAKLLHVASFWLVFVQQIIINKICNAGIFIFRIRKGINVLVATPGRLLDHIEVKCAVHSLSLCMHVHISVLQLQLLEKPRLSSIHSTVGSITSYSRIRVYTVF